MVCLFIAARTADDADLHARSSASALHVGTAQRGVRAPCAACSNARTAALSGREASAKCSAD